MMTEAGHPELVQVAAEHVSPSTRQRELRALRDAMTETKVDVARIVTLGETETVEFEGHDVAIVPAWRWLLEPAIS